MNASDRPIPKINENEETEANAPGTITPKEKGEEQQVKNEDAKQKFATDKAQQLMAVEEAAKKAEQRGEDPKKAAKKAQQKQVEEQAEADAKTASNDPSEATLNAGLKAVKAEAAAVERDNVANMMKSLPSGKGLRTAFEKIEEAKIEKSQPDKKDDNANMMEKAEQETGKEPGESNKNLSKEARSALEQAENAKTKGSIKPLAPEVDLVKEEKKIEKASLPGSKSEDADRQMYGKSQSELAKDMAQPGINTGGETQAAADATAKSAAKMQEMEQAQGAGGEEVTELSA